MKVIGLISGTSTDGIDAALVEISGRAPHPKIGLIRFKTYPYPAGVKRRLIAAQASGSVAQICHFNFLLGELFARAAMKIAEEAEVPLDEVALIGSHGQTVHHLPVPRKDAGFAIRSTLQIAEPSVIAERTGITTIADFRPRDLAAGGQGAPLTPFLHAILFSGDRTARIVVNIGGISNVTYLPPGGRFDRILAFDVGPGNMLIDGLVHDLSRGKRAMDRGGRVAASGRVVRPLLACLVRHPFVRSRPPKTTGREVFGLPMIERLRSMGGRFSTADLIATATAFTADAISYNVRTFLPKEPAAEMIVGGGGGHNPTLMRMLAERVAPIPLRTFEDFGFASRAIEATAFALFAYQTATGEPSNVPSATGATHPVVLGKIVPGRNFKGLFS